MKISFLLFGFSIFFFCASAQNNGCILGNCSSGLGTYRWDSGNEYTGEWINGVRSGLGSYDLEDGSFYYGFFQNDKMEGKGFYIGAEEEDDQIGIFHEGVFSENADMASSGCVLGNCYDGVGVYLWETDDLYIGQWVDNKPNGYGRYDWSDGSSYIGYLKDGKLDGQGQYISKDNQSMTGQFVDGVFQGATH